MSKTLGHLKVGRYAVTQGKAGVAQEHTDPQQSGESEYEQQQNELSSGCHSRSISKPRALSNVAALPAGLCADGSVTIMGTAETEDAMRIRLATWNVNSIRTRMESVLRWLESSDTDVLLMQETKVTNDLFPRQPLEDAGYRLAVHGQKRYNGVAIASRLPMEQVTTGLPSGYLPEQARAISATVAGTRLHNVYVPNGGSPESPRFLEKLRFLEELKAMSTEWTVDSRCIIAGDFNVAPGPEDVFDAEEMEGRVCYHPEERRRIADLAATGLLDLFRRVSPEGTAYSWWDYRAAAFRRDRGMRLDLLLATPAVAEGLKSCEIHRDVRAWERPSDHVPVSADLEMSNEGSGL